MPVVLASQLDDTLVLIPEWIIDNASFLRWAESDEAPERGKIGYFQGDIWIDQTMETDFHNFIKTEIAVSVGAWVREQDLGRYYTDGMLFSCPELQLSSEPDGLFVRRASKATGKVWLEKGKSSMVLYGVPDMVLEVVSRSSRNKDMNRLFKLYHQAGIEEYWIVDSTDKHPSLMIYQHTPSGYVPVRSFEGWVNSTVLNAGFRLVIDEENEDVRVERQSIQL